MQKAEDRRQNTEARRKAATTFKDLIVWQKAHQLVLSIYRVTAEFPKHELYGLVSQVRRASVSVAANIAEGFPKRSTMDKARYLNISQGSLEEVRYYLILAEDLKYANTDEFHKQTTEVSKLLEAYRSSILNSEF
jgi:four helix bundle protein